MDFIGLAQGMERKQAVVILLMHLQFPWNVRDFGIRKNYQLVLFVVGNNTSLQNFTMLDNNIGSYVLYHEWALNDNFDTRKANVFIQE